MQSRTFTLAIYGGGAMTDEWRARVVDALTTQFRRDVMHGVAHVFRVMARDEMPMMVPSLGSTVGTGDDSSEVRHLLGMMGPHLALVVGMLIALETRRVPGAWASGHAPVTVDVPWTVDMSHALMNATTRMAQTVIYDEQVSSGEMRVHDDGSDTDSDADMDAMPTRSYGYQRYRRLFDLDMFDADDYATFGHAEGLRASKLQTDYMANAALEKALVASYARSPDLRRVTSHRGPWPCARLNDARTGNALVLVRRFPDSSEPPDAQPDAMLSVQLVSTYTASGNGTRPGMRIDFNMADGAQIPYATARTGVRVIAGGIFDALGAAQLT